MSNEFKYKCSSCGFSDDENFPACPKCGNVYSWHINHDAYESLRAELEQAMQLISFLRGGHENEIPILKQELAAEKARSAKLVEALKVVVDSPEQASDAYGAFKISIRAARSALAAYAKGEGAE